MDDARRQVRRLAREGFDEADRRWLVGSEGLLDACRNAVADGDRGFLDEMGTSPLWRRLDDESVSMPGPGPAERAASLICAGKLAWWCVDGSGDGRAGVPRWLEAAVRGFSDPSGPDRPPWSAPPAMLDALAPAAGDPLARAEGLMEAAHRACPHLALLAVGDLVHHFLPGSAGPATSGRATALILTSRHREGELVRLVMVERTGPPGLAVDPLVGPFTRADGAFHAALQNAWQSTRSPSLSARWAVMSERTGAALEVIQGGSVGAGAALTLRYLSDSGLPPLDPSWAITGAIDASGALGSLLDDDRNLATYRTKLMTAGVRSVIVPRCDHPHLAGLVEAGGLQTRLVPAASVAEIIDAAERHVAGSRAYLEALRAGAEPVAPPKPGVSPYRGLATYREEDRAFFLGRSKEIAELEARVRGPGPVTLVGPSGCGKSSLVFAGLVPALREAGYSVVTVRPSAGRTVFTALAAALLPLLEPALTEVERLREVPRLAELLETRGLADTAPAVLRATGAAELVLVLDQGEELLAQQPEMVERLAVHLFGPEAPDRLSVLLTLRADFLSAALKMPALSDPLRQSVYTLGAMSITQLRDVIAVPAAAAGIGFQDGLVDRILADVGSDPGALPLLGLTLSLLWERRAGAQLTHAGYDELGRVPGSLARYAEEVWRTTGLAEDDDVARQLFTQLVRIGPAGEITRRVATSDDVGPLQWDLARRLATTRLLVVGRDAEGRETVELAHEALVDNWSRLQRWVAADREFREWQEAARADLARWEQAARDPNLLPRGPTLEAALRWHAERRDALSAAEIDFVQQARRQHRKASLRRRALFSGLVATLVLALLLGGLFGYQGTVVQRQTAAATSRSLAASSAEWAERDPVYSTLLALAAYRRSPTGESQNALFRQYVDNDDIDTILSGAPAPLREVQVSADGTVAAGRSITGVVTLWQRSASGGTSSTPPIGVQDRMMLVPDGSALWLLALGPNQLTRYDIGAGSVGQVIPLDLPTRDPLVHMVTVSSDGARIAGVFEPRAGGDARAMVWDAQSGRRLADLPVDQQPSDIAFGLGGDSLVMAFTAELFVDPSLQRLEVWDLATASRRVFDGPVDAAVLPGADVAVTCRTSEGPTRFTALRLTDLVELGQVDVQLGSCVDFATDPSGRTVVTRTGFSAGDGAVLDLQTGSTIVDIPLPAGMGDIALPAGTEKLELLPVLVGSGADPQLAMSNSSRVVLATVPKEAVIPGVQWGKVLPDGKHIVVVFRQGAAVGVVPTGGTVPVSQADRPAPTRRSGPGELAISGDGTLLADRVSPDLVMVRRLPGLEPLGAVGTPPVPTERQGSAEDDDLAVNHQHFFDADNRLVTLVGHQAAWWDPASGRRLASLDLVQLRHADRNETVSLAPFSDPARVGLVVWGRPDVQIVDIASGARVRTIPVGPLVRAVQFEPGSSSTMAILRSGGVIELWDTERARRVLGPLRIGADTRDEIGAFTAQFLDRPGEYLTASFGQITTWKVGSASPTSSLRLGDGRFIRDASADGRVLLYENETNGGGELFLDPRIWRSRLCEIIGRRGFTGEERAGLPADTPEGDLCSG